MKKQEDKDKCMKEVSITPHPYTVSIHSFSMVRVPPVSVRVPCHTAPCIYVYT